MAIISRFDPSIHYLGRLCARHHEWEQSGQSRRFLSNRPCVLCAKMWSSQQPAEYTTEIQALMRRRKRQRHRAEHEKYTRRDLQRQLGLFDDRCAYCAGDVSPCPCCGATRLTWDHVNARGPDALCNLVPACHRCNTSKNAAPWRLWFARQPFYAAERAARIAAVIDQER